MKDLFRGRHASLSQRGFTLIETIVAVALLGIAVVGVLSVIAASARTSSRGRESTTLLQLARAQIESIQQAPFQASVANYSIITPVPAGFAVSVTSTDPGTVYRYASPSTTTITGSVQQVTVTVTGDYGSMSLSFYKVEAP
ncbi:MAG: prepilin-type N-terminal cleavage/methylation domain-containing protein [Chloroflexi bacterium]|nr:prepilin-type N-terminal cleavage/methylation domain-containing protein [Chloroflexota bacterium]